MNSLKSIKLKLAEFFSKRDHVDFDDEERLTINDGINNRNTFFVALAMIVCLLLLATYLWLDFTKKSHANEFIPKKKTTFGTVVGSGFSAEDAQSAANLNATDITQLQKGYHSLESSVKRMTQTLEQQNKERSAMSNKIDQLEAKNRDLKTQLGVAIDMAKHATPPVTTSKAQHQKNAFGQVANASSNSNYLSNTHSNFLSDRQPTYANQDLLSKSARKHSYGDINSLSSMAVGSIDSFTFETTKKNTYKRTWKNYVPSGSWVTAVMTGGAEANAGVSGESNTAPVEFEMLNDGFLPNGKHSTLKGCVMTGSAHGDISSQRGIVRGDRLSCVRKNGTILDIPVQATVFNFGKNGIRGEAIMRNSKILQSVGWSGLLSGIGNAAKSATQTSSVSPLGATSTVDPSQMGLNIVGSMTSDAASKLSEYYLKLAEQYHPDIDLRQGAVVNIVFLKGFPLTGSAVKKYSEALDASRSQANNPAAAMVGITTNPLSAVTQTANIVNRNIQGTHNGV